MSNELRVTEIIYSTSVERLSQFGNRWEKVSLKAELPEGSDPLEGLEVLKQTAADFLNGSDGVVENENTSPIEAMQQPLVSGKIEPDEKTLESYANYKKLGNKKMMETIASIYNIPEYA